MTWFRKLTKVEKRKQREDIKEQLLIYGVLIVIILVVLGFFQFSSQTVVSNENESFNDSYIKEALNYTEPYQTDIPDDFVVPNTTEIINTTNISN